MSGEEKIDKTEGEADVEEGDCGCCSCCVPADAKEKRKLEWDPEDDKHPVIDLEGRRTFSLCCCLGTDWPGLLVFFAAMGAVFILWLLSFYKGQVDIALYGMAWNGNICGKGATAEAPFQVWINPTATGSIFHTAVCMPECPTINSTNTFATNDTATFESLNTAVASISDASARAAAEADVSKLDNRVSDLKTEVTYMSAQLGDTAAELDRSHLNCLCNKVSNYTLFKKFMSTKVTVDGELYDINARCSEQPAASYGYIELPFKDAFSEFAGDGMNLMVDRQAMDKVPCAFRYRTTQSFTRCMPWVSANAVGRLTLVMGTSGVADGVSASFNAFSQRVVYYSNDIYKGGWIIVAASSVALVLSITLIYFMSVSCFDDNCRVLTWIVWGTLISLLLLFIALTLITGYQFKFYKDRFETTPELTTHAEDEQAMYIYGVSMCVAALCAFCHLVFISPCCCGEQIQTSIEIIIAASECFDRAWALIFSPVYHNLAIIVAIVCWLIGLLFMSTAGEIVVLPHTGVHSLAYDETFQKAVLYYAFMIIWIVEWIGAVGFMVTAGAIIVFFDNKKGEEAEANRKWPLWESIKLVICNHLGTAAVGSFFITLVVVVRWVLALALEKASQESQSSALEYIKACINCICECIEQCMRYMVNTAYILTVLEGRWFFSAVCGGLFTLLGNAGTVLALNYIAFAVLWLCKLAVPLLCTGMAYLLLESGKMGVTKYDLSSSFNVLVPVFLISCIFSFTFLGLLGTAIDVVLIAYLKVQDLAEDNEKVWECIPPQMQAMHGIIKNAQDEDAENEAKNNKEGEGKPLMDPANEDETAKADPEA